MSQEVDRAVSGKGTAGARARRPYSPVRLRRALSLVRRTGRAPLLVSNARVTRHVRLLGWCEAILARYGITEHRLSAAGAVLLTRPEGSITVIDRRSRHLYLAQTWAPRLTLTLVSHNATGSVGQTSGVSSPFAAGSAWRTVRPSGKSSQLVPVRELRPRLPAEAAASGMHHRLEARATAINLTAGNGLPELSQTADSRSPFLRSESAAPGARPAAPARVAPVYTRPPTSMPAAAPAPPRVAFDEPGRSFVREPAALRPIEADSAAIERISERVIQQIGHRIQAYRERTGRV